MAYSPLAGSTKPKAGSTITAGQNHRQLLATGGMEGKVKLWDTGGVFVMTQAALYAAFQSRVSAMLLSLTTPLQWKACVSHLLVTQ